MQLQIFVTISLVSGIVPPLREGLEHLNDQSVYEKLPGVRVHKGPGH